MYPQGKFYQLDILHSRLDTTFDLATLIEVLEHIDPTLQGKFIKSLSAILPKNGVLLLDGSS